MNKANMEEKAPHVKTSILAIISLFLCLCGVCTNGFTAVVAVALGIISLVKIIKSCGQLRGRSISVASIVISLILIYCTAPFYIPSLRVSRILRKGLFAKLPETATEVNAEMFHPWFSFAAIQYLTFKAAPEDIEIFLSQSPCLKNADVEIFSPEHMYLPFSEIGNKSVYGKHEYFRPESNPPYWDNFTIKKKGRKFYIFSPKDGEYVEVIVNDATNTVYIIFAIG